MTENNGSVADLVDMVGRQSPSFLDLITSENSEDWDTAIDSLIVRAVQHLEQNKKNFRALDEEGLTGVLVAGLTNTFIDVTQETHSNGHVDITIKSTEEFLFHRTLGEAKIYDGPEYHIGGIKQLIERYSTGRECRGFVIAYVTKKDIVNLMQKIRDKMDADLPVDQADKTTEHRLKWSFLSLHKHNSGEVLGVCHIGCNLFVEENK